MRLPHITSLVAAGLIAVGLGIYATRRAPERPAAPPAAHPQQHVAPPVLPQAEPLVSATAATARRFRLETREGAAIGELGIPRLRLHDVLIDGTNEPDLAKGPGVYGPDSLPGEGGLVYIAGHRTTHGAPFGDLNLLRRGDAISIAMPYGTFRYIVTGYRIVPATAVSVLRSHGREQLILQTCHPKYSATHRYLVYARPAQPFRQRRANLMGSSPSQETGT